MITRIFISFLIKLLHLCVILLGIIIFPLAYLMKKDNHYPKWAWWWDNQVHGINGGNFYLKQTRNWPYWFRCFVWTMIRNSSYNFCKYVISVKSSGIQTTIGNPNIARDREAGFFYTRDRWAWDIQLVKPYKSNKKCFHFRCGWKLNRKSIGEDCQFVFMISPYKGYSGK